MIGPKLWPLECSQGFSMIWPTDLVFDLTWLIFELDWDIVKMIILSKFDDDKTKTVASRVFTRFIYDLTYWPCFWPQPPPYSNLSEILSRWSFWASLMKIGQKLWPLERSQGFLKIWPTDLVFDLTWPILELDWDIVKMIIWASLMKIGRKLWPLECSQGFLKIWPTDLVFDPTWPIFELDRDIVRMIILSKFDDDWTKTMASRVFTRFFYDLTYWPCFWPNMTHIWTWLRYCQDDHSEQVSWWLDQNWGLLSVHKVFLWFDLLTLFLTPHDPYSNLTKILSRWSFWASLIIGPKLWHLECSQAKSWRKTHRTHDDRQRLVTIAHH